MSGEWSLGRGDVWRLSIGSFSAKAYMDSATGTWRASFDRWRPKEAYSCQADAKAAAIKLAKAYIEPAYLSLFPRPSGDDWT